jgi:hypothetical protein
MKPMSMKGRTELFDSIRARYQRAAWQEKGTLIDGFIAACLLR